MENAKKTPQKPVRATRCDDCEYYDYDEEWGAYVCNMSLDEDEMQRFLTGNNASCPYYKYYNEYAFVRKQN